MQFEKIRKINKSKIIIGSLIGLGVIGAITILPSYSKYRTTQSFNLVKGKITYKQPDLNLVAMYTIEDGIETPIDTVPPEDDGNYTYTLNTSRSECTYNGGKVGNITYEDGYLTFSQINKKGTKCNVYFDKEKNPEMLPPKQANELFADLKNSAQNIGTTFTSIETGPGGLYKTTDATYGGTTYYYRGVVTNNYVVFAGKCWRIIRINGNGSIRLIFDSSTTECHANGLGENAKTIQAYNTNDDDNAYVGYMTGINNGHSTSYGQAHTNTYDSDIKAYLDSWYDTNLAGYASYIDEEAGFCNYRGLGSGYSSSSSYKTTETYFAAYDRIGKTPTNATPTFGCGTRSDDLFTPSTSSKGNKILGTGTSRPIGLITADEVVYAGALYGSSGTNRSYYLYNKASYWTMTPRAYISKNGVYGSVIYTVDKSGSISEVGSPGYDVGVRPVINLKSNTQFSTKVNEEKGVQTNPYVVQ